MTLLRDVSQWAEKKERYSALYFCYIKLEKWKKEEENEKTVKTEIDGEDKEEEKSFFFKLIFFLLFFRVNSVTSLHFAPLFVKF